MAFIQYIMQIMFSVMMLSMMAFMIPRGEASAQRIWEVLNLHPRIPAQGAEAEQAALPAVTELRFEHVSFSYPGAEAPAIDDISFTAKAGQTLAMIGGTGSGKSTLLNLICRFYDPTQGHIDLDGKDLRQWSLSTLRENLGLVPQRAVLFSGSVLENMRYGDASSSEDSVTRALKTAQAWDFVSEYDDGIHHIESQRGPATTPVHCPRIGSTPSRLSL